MLTYPVDKVIIISILNLVNEYGVTILDHLIVSPQLLSDYNQQCHNATPQINPVCCEEASRSDNRNMTIRKLPK